MDAVAKTKKSIGPVDLERWRKVIADGRLEYERLETIAAVFQDLGPNTDKRVREALAKYLSDYVYRHARKVVWSSYPNRGSDIADCLHEKIMTALLKPGCPDAVSLRKNFHAVLKSRLFDAILAEQRGWRDGDADKAREDLKKEKLRKENKRKAKAAKAAGKSVETASAEGEDIQFERIEHETDGEGSEVDVEFRPIQHFDSSFLEGVRNIDDEIDFNRQLHKLVTDPKKRLAIRLAMAGVPRKSKRTHSIAKAIGVDERTVRAWIDEILKEPNKGKESE